MENRKLRIAFLTSMVYNLLSEEIWQGVVDVLGKQNIDLFCFSSRRIEPSYPKEVDNPASIIYDLISPEDFDGLIIYGGALGNSLSLEEMEQFCKKYDPLPIINISLPIPGIHSITISNYKGLYDLIEHLIVKHKYRKIAFIKGPEEHEEAQERYKAYIDALRDYEIPFDPAFVAPGHFEKKSGEEAITLFFDEREIRPEAIVAVDDETAIGAIQALKRKNLSIPHDIAVTGFDDVAAARNMRPSLSTVKQPTFELGQIAAKRLLDILEGQEFEKKIVAPTEMVLRQSCGCPGETIQQFEFKKQEKDQTLSESLNSTDQIVASILGDDRGSHYGKETIQKLTKDMLFSIEKASLEPFLTTFHSEALNDRLLSLLHHYAYPYIEEDKKEFFSNMVQQARVLIVREEEIKEKEKWLLWHQRDLGVIYVNQRLHGSMSLDCLFDRVVENFPTLGIRSCYICFYKNSEVPLNQARLMLAYNERGKINTEREDSTFETKKILPPYLIDTPEKHQKIILPLHFNEEAIGYTIYEIPSDSTNVTNAINWQLSGIIKRLSLEKERQERTEELTALNRNLKNEILERKQAVEAAEAANRTKSKFLANMSHEIRTPMNAILGFTEILDSQIKDSEQRGFLASISSSSNLLLNIINDILDLSVVEADKLVLENEVFDIRSVLEEMQTLFSKKVADKGLEFVPDFDEELPTAVYLDKSRIRQILINLIGNAIKFTKRGYIKLSARFQPKSEAQGSELIIEVEDSGIGIPENQKEKIFAVFEKQTGQSHAEYGGTGLGLSITKRLVELMNGTIQVSGEVGHGSLFTLKLKDVETTEKVDSFNSKATFDPDSVFFEQSTILNVDNLEQNRRIVREFLKKNPLNVIDAANGEEAIELTKKHRPNLILMDMKMPVLDGYEAASRIKKDPDLREIPIISLSASAMKEELKKISLCCDGYLMKPLRKVNLITKLMDYLPWSIQESEVEAVSVEEEYSQTEPPTLSSEEKDQLPEILAILENEMTDQWNQIKSAYNFNKIHEFAEEIKTLGETYHLEYLINWGVTLAQQAKSFDMKNLPDTIQYFPGLVQMVRAEL